MKTTRIMLVAAALAAAISFGPSVYAQTGVTQTTPGTVPLNLQSTTDGSTTIVTPTPGTAVVVAAPPETWPQTILAWAMAIFASTVAVVGPILGRYAVKMAQAGAARAGFVLSETVLARLYTLVVNGVNKAGAEAAKKGEVVRRDSEFAAGVLDYVKEHGEDVAKKLGVSVDSPEFASAVEARVEKAINDPEVPTPAAITPVSAGGAAPVVVTPIQG
jgi:hypothetical protein